MEKKNILFYDSECTLCSRFQKALLMLDNNKSLAYKSIHDEDTFELYPMLDEEACEQEIHLLDKEGNILRGAEVVEFLIKLIPGVKKFSWLIETESSKKAMDMFYERLNDMRIMKRRNCFRCGNPRRRHYDIRGEK